MVSAASGLNHTQSIFTSGTAAKSSSSAIANATVAGTSTASVSAVPVTAQPVAPGDTSSNTNTSPVLLPGTPSNAVTASSDTLATQTSPATSQTASTDTTNTTPSPTFNSPGTPPTYTASFGPAVPMVNGAPVDPPFVMLNQALATAAAPVDVQLGLVDGNTSNDLVGLNADGTLTVALNAGDGYWQTVRTLNLGIGSANGLGLMRFGADQSLDALVQTPNGIALARGDGHGNFTLAQTVALGAPGTLAPSPGGRVQLATNLPDPSGSFSRLVTVAPGTNEVLVFPANSPNALSSPTRYASGGSQPVAVVVADVVGDATPDLIVGHRNGDVTFFQGSANGQFTLRSDLTVHGLGSITGLAVGNFDGTGTAIAVSSSTGVNLLKNLHGQALTPIIVNGDFVSGLTGWTINGPVVVPGAYAELQENGSGLLTTLSQSFLVPANPTTLTFDLTNIGLDSPNGSVPDAFEVSLLNSQNTSVVPTATVGGVAATSFLNINPGGVVSVASGVSFDGEHASLDISHLTAGASSRSTSTWWATRRSRDRLWTWPTCRSRRSRSPRRLPSPRWPARLGRRAPSPSGTSTGTAIRASW